MPTLIGERFKYMKANQRRTFFRQMTRGGGRNYRYIGKGTKSKNNRITYSGKVSTLQLRSPQLVPDRYRCKMLFADIRSFTGTPTALRVYRGNSVYDPDQTGIGTNAVGFDQFNTLYNYFRVLGSKIKVSYVTSNSTISQTLVVLPSLTTVGPSNIPSTQANPYAKHIVVSATAGGESLGILTHYMSTKKQFGIKSIESENDFTNMSTATNPVSQWYWLVQAYSMDGTSASSGFLNVQITYYVEWFDRISITET